MTVIAVLADPPRPGLVLPELTDDGPFSESEAASLYGAMLKDTFLTAHRSGGDLLVNYRPDDQLPGDDGDSEAELRALAADALGDTSDVRFEVQVGPTFDARVGNTVAHLLREEDVRSVAAVRGTGPMLLRSTIDSAAMKLRRSEVVLGPGLRGRTYFAGFTEPIDFDGAFAAPELETLTDRAADADLDANFLPTQPVVETPADLRTVLPALNARIRAERIVPVNTAEFVRERGLGVVGDGDGGRIVRG